MAVETMRPQTSQPNFLDAVVQMTKLTLDGKMHWEVFSTSPNHRFIKTNVFRTEYNGVKYELEADEASNRYELIIINDDGVRLFKFPPVEGLSGLYQVIQRQSLNIDKVLRSLFE